MYVQGGGCTCHTPPPIMDEVFKCRKTINEMGGDIPASGNFLSGNFPGGGNFTGGSLMGGNFLGGNFPRGTFPRTF